MVVIFYLATTSSEIDTIKNSWDKLNHIIAFFTLYILLDFSYKNISFLKKILLLLCIAFSIEIIQYFIPNRQFSFYDIFADIIGMFLGFLFSLIVYKYVTLNFVKDNYNK
ncbi:VanZ family protein [Arcobacter sp. YIC-464]|uniref:VanZ family protein n=1 Tax=Arcobacter sp. YIC-464 TaxID=3376631 RepID=UPI003C16B029